MTANPWTRLWATEVEPDEIPPGTIAAFLKAPRRDGEYGMVDALIAGLDRFPLTHAGIIVRPGSVTEVVHSTLEGLIREPLASSGSPHRHGPLFLFAHAEASAETVAAVVDEAIRRADDADEHRDAYPKADPLLVAFLLRLRNGSRFDEHAHQRLAELFGVAVADPNLSGRMCAAFIAELFAATGATLAPPDERSAFTTGLVDGYPTEPVVPTWTIELIGATLARVAGRVAELADGAPGLDPETRTEVAATLRDLADDPAIADATAAWIIGASPAGEGDPPVVTRLEEAFGRVRPDRSDRRGSIRFSTVNDLVRSPHIVPLGHVIGWADEPTTEN